jgi:RecA/RadA recombinase
MKKQVSDVLSDELDKAEALIQSTLKKKSQKAPLNVAELVAKAQGRFDKKKKGISARMKSGDEIALSQNPEDYICSSEINQFWKPLTGLIGLPFGRIVQIAGRPDSGKSTSAMIIMKAAQEGGTLVILWDAEGKFDSVRYRDRMGGDPSQIPVAPSRNILEGVQQVVAYVKAAKEMDPEQKILIVWDSVGASINSAEDEENDDYSKQPGVTAKEVSWAIRRFNQLMEKFRDSNGNYTIAILCINQVYANIGFMKSGYVQKGGAELEYLSSLILEMSRKATLTRVRNKQKNKYGITTVAKVKKNHLFGGEDCVAELDLVVSAAGIELASEIKGKSNENDDLEEDDE